MAKFIQHADWEDLVSYALEYNYTGGSGAGFSFPCDSEGNIDESRLKPAGLENLRKCRCGEHKVDPPFIREDKWTSKIHAIIECEYCGDEVELFNSWLNTCECGADYNGSGSLLAPRSQWGEETGEQASDLCMGFDD